VKEYTVRDVLCGDRNKRRGIIVAQGTIRLVCAPLMRSGHLKPFEALFCHSEQEYPKSVNQEQLNISIVCHQRIVYYTSSRYR